MFQPKGLSGQGASNAPKASEAMRNLAVSAGTGCTLFVFLLSITGQVSQLYPNGFHEGWTYGPMIAIMAVILLFVSRAKTLRRGMLAYRILLVCSFALTALWMLLAMAFSALHPLSLASGQVDGFFVAFEASRLLPTALLFILWNLHMSMNRVSSAAQVSAFSIFFGSALFAISLVFDATGMIVMVGLSLMASCLLLVFLGRMFTFNAGSPFSVQLSLAEQTKTLPKSESPSRVRSLFFLSRVFWYLFTTIFMALSYGRPALETPNILFACLAAIALIMNAVCALLMSKGRASSCLLALAVPTFLLCILTVVFSSTYEENAACILVVIIVLARHMLFYIQLPSYRSMTSMDPIRYAFFERLIPVLANYICRLVLSIEILNDLIREIGASMSLGSFAAIMICATAVLVFVSIRHIIRYYPSDGRSPRGRASESTADDLSSTVALVGKKDSLTPRETEVLEYLAKGYSKPYIAKILCVSLATVKSHTNSIYKKLAVSSHDELIDYVKAKASL